MDLKDYIGIIKRRLGWLLGIFALQVGIFVFINQVIDTEYYSAQALMSIGPPQMPRDPNAIWRINQIDFNTELRKLSKPAVAEYRGLYHPVVFCLRVIEDVTRRRGGIDAFGDKMDDETLLRLANETLRGYQPHKGRQGRSAATPQSSETDHYPFIAPVARGLDAQDRGKFVGDYADRGRFADLGALAKLLADPDYELHDRHAFSQALIEAMMAKTNDALSYAYAGGKAIIAPQSGPRVDRQATTRFFTVSVDHQTFQGAWLYAASHVFAGIYYANNEAKWMQAAELRNISEQIQELERRERELRATIAGFRSDLELPPEEDPQVFFQKRLDTLETRVNQLITLRDELQNRRDIAETERADLLSYQRLLSSEHGVEISNATAEKIFQSTQRIQYLRQEMDKLRIKEQEMRRRLTPEHPEMVKIQGEIATLSEELWTDKFRRVDEKIDEIEYRIKQSQVSLDQAVGYLAEPAALLAELKRKRHEYSANQSLYDQAETDLESTTTVLHQLRERISERREVQAGTQGNFYYDHESGYTFTSVIMPKATDQVIFLAVVLAALVAVGVVALWEYLSNEIRTEYDIRRYLNLPVLGVVPKVKGDILLPETTVKSRISELFNTAATLIRSHAKELSLRSFVVSSAHPKEGKTTVSVNLSVAMARKGMRVCLIDSDLRRPQIHHIFGLDNVMGLSTVLERKVPGMDGGDVAGSVSGFEHVIRTETDISNLHVLTSGPTPPDPVGLLESDLMKQLVQEIVDRYDVAIFDTPPIGSVGDTLILSQYTDANIFIVGAGQVVHADVTRAKRLLTSVHTNILGVFLNKSLETKSKEYYYYYSDDTRRVGRIR